MQRVLVLGSSGSGKSTLARQLGKTLDLEVIHLDSYFWQPNWIETPADLWEQKLNQLLEKEHWVMDGNYTSSLERRLAYSDTVIFLDLSRARCFWRVLGRYLKHRGANRPELPEGCNEKIDLDFIKWIWNYPNRSRRQILQMLDYQPQIEVIKLHGSAEIEAFIAIMEKDNG
jgi:adenylate kinase family enzyme